MRKNLQKTERKIIIVILFCWEWLQNWIVPINFKIYKGQDES